MVDKAKRIDRVFHALAHPTRRAILRRVAVRERSVVELAAPYAMSLEAVSKHVRVLEEAELLHRTRRGRSSRVRLRPAQLRDATLLLAHLAGMWNERLDALERLLREMEE